MNELCSTPLQDYIFNGIVALFFGIVCAGELRDYFAQRGGFLSPLMAGAFALWAISRMMP